MSRDAHMAATVAPLVFCYLFTKIKNRNTKNLFPSFSFMPKKGEATITNKAFPFLLLRIQTKYLTQLTISFLFLLSPACIKKRKHMISSFSFFIFNPKKQNDGIYTDPWLLTAYITYPNRA